MLSCLPGRSHVGTRTRLRRRLDSQFGADKSRKAGSLNLVTADVDVMPPPPAPVTREDPRATLTRTAFARNPTSRNLVRRYGERPDTLLRDAVGSYRAGEAGDVLAFAFDVVCR